MKRTIKFIAGLFILAATVLLVRQAYPFFRQAWESKSWKATPALIVQSEVDQVYDGEGRKYRLLFTYSYAVNEVSYQNSGRYMSYGETPQRSQAGLQNFVAEHPAGDSLKVFYNPLIPAESSPKVGFIWLHWIFLGLTCFFTYLALRLLFFPGKVRSRWL